MGSGIILRSSSILAMFPPCVWCVVRGQFLTVPRVLPHLFLKIVRGSQWMQLW